MQETFNLASDEEDIKEVVDDEDNIWKVSSEAKAGNSIKPARPLGELGLPLPASCGTCSTLRILGEINLAHFRTRTT